MICWFTLLARRYLLYNKLFFNQFDYKASISWFLSFKKILLRYSVSNKRWL
jgi:hypothetical protein